MPHNRSLTLKVATQTDFAIPVLILFLLAVISAALSPQPLYLTLFVLFIFGVWWITHILRFPKVNKLELNAVFFSDGRVSLESGRKFTSVGMLDGQQWCSHHVTVLRYLSGGQLQFLVLLSAQQNSDDYRRLKVWLRQNICTGSNKNSAGHLARKTGMK